jgi:hypothetical protein
MENVVTYHNIAATFETLSAKTPDEAKMHSTGRYQCDCDWALIPYSTCIP